MRSHLSTAGSFKLTSATPRSSNIWKGLIASIAALSVLGWRVTSSEGVVGVT